MAIWAWLSQRLRAPRRAGPAIPDALWVATLADYPFLADRPAAAVSALRQLSQDFLRQKEFFGADGLVITDAMAVAIAAQACLPVLHLRHGGAPLDWYSDFVGIVVHPGEVVARREFTDDDGVVHHYDEVLSGEAMHRGPVMLSWSDVARSGATAREGYNVVVHEFAHKIDMRDGRDDGCPPLPPGLRGHASVAAARKAWRHDWQRAFERFREQHIVAERFGGALPWLDAYGAESLTEFFAVACEGYFVNRSRFATDFPDLMPWLDAFFTPALD